MDFKCTKTGCMKKFCAYCCPYKRDLLNNNNFEKTIEIFPRVIVCKKLARCETYQQVLTVRNTGTLTRRMKFATEPNSDVAFRINGNPELTSGAMVSIDIYVEPTKKKSMQQNRFFYVVAEHPDIVWEVPILVIDKCPQVFVPQLICLHKVPANTISNYQFVIYNPLETEVHFCICSCCDYLNVVPLSSTVAGKDYCKILINGKVPSQATTTGLTVSLNNGKPITICIHMEPTDQIIYLGANVLTFEDTYMGSRVQKNLRICNKSMESASFRWTCSENAKDSTTDEIADEELVINDCLRIRNKRGCISPMNSALSIVTFKPPIDLDYNEEEEPPFKISVSIYLHCPIIGTLSYQLNINASILGPEIEISPKDTDVGSIYMGQMQCMRFEAVNRGPIIGRIYFKEQTDVAEMRCTFTPKSIDLKSQCSAVFQLKYYRRDIGKFLTKLTFKIKSGNIISILLRGTSQAARVKIWPEIFEYGNIPICIPQKRFALVVNPLPVPIVVEPMVVDDGVEDPLILCVDNSKLPLNARPATYYTLTSCKSRFAVESEEELKPSYSDFGLDAKESSSSTSSISRDLSWMFRDKVLDDIPAMAEMLLQNVKARQAHNNPESGMQIIDAALDCILDRSDYFEDLRHKQNYLNMDWQALPTDAKEVGIEVERFYLKPNESKSFPVLLIPNSTGPCTKTIEFKTCPVGAELSDLKAAVRSKNMANYLCLQYRCTIPTLECNDHIRFSNPLYVDMQHYFQMKFRNIDSLPGFILYKVIPRTPQGIMRVEKSDRKFYLGPNEEVTVDCYVIFRDVGTVMLRGLFHLLGKVIDFPFNIEADVLPPKVRIIPSKLTNKQQVLETTRTRIFIENICPTVARFYLSLKNDKYQCVEPMGGSLAPNQKILISIFSKFFDPGTYKNVIYVHLKHAEKLCVPVTFTIEGTPLILEPNIKLGLDCGCLFKSTGSKDNLVTITNFGEKSYRLLFQKKKAKTNLLVPVSIFNVIPNGLTMNPKSKEIINLKMDISKKVNVEEEFSVDAMGEDNCRFKFFTFTAKVTIINAKVVWSMNEVCLESGNADETKDKMIETVSLTNTTALIANVNLTVIGNFILHDVETGSTESTVDFCLQGKQVKHFTVYLKEEEIDPHDLCQCYKGSVKVKVNNKAQKTLLMHAKIVSPALKICSRDITLFAQNAESYAHIYIQNCSPLVASFVWRETTFTLTENNLPNNYELLSAKTISELAFSLPNDFVLKIPEFIQPNQLPICLSEASSSMAEEFVEEYNPSSTNNLNEDIARSSLTKSSPIVISSDSAMDESKPLKPLPTNADKSQIDVKQILKYFGFLQPTNSGPPTTTNKDLELGGGDRNYGEKIKKDEEKKNTSSIIFQLKRGNLSPKSMFKAYMYLPPIANGNTLNAKFDLHVLGGRTENLNITVTSVKGRVQFSKTDIDIGKQVWHKTIAETIHLTNNCPYAVKISVVENYETRSVEYHVIEGCVGIGSPKQFIMMPGTCTSIEWKIIPGMRYNFLEDVGVEINNNTTAIPIHFHGAGFMPIIIPEFLNRMVEKSVETVASYLRMRKIFENVQAKQTQSQINDSIKDEVTFASTNISSTETKSSLSKKRRRRPSEEFVTLNYSEDVGPRALEIERLVETWKFIAEVDTSEEFRTKFHKFYCDCLNHQAMEFDSVVNLKIKICRPMPWELPAYLMDMGVMEVNETKNFDLELSFLGPGRAFLSARTRTAIPGLMAWFKDIQSVGSSTDFVFFMQSPEESTLKTYRNINERDPIYDTNNSSQETVKLSHAHSYDVDETGTHRRKTPSKDPKKIKERYNKISLPFKENKNSLILAEICQCSDENLNNSTFKLLLMFTVMKQFYENNQQIEDYLFIDIHLGPTLPILLRGQVVTSKSSEDATNSSSK